MEGNSLKIERITTENSLLEPGIQYIWKQWGSDENFVFYKDCIENSVQQPAGLPQFYLLLNEREIIGCYALLTNDIISRQDLMPWFACLYIEERYRNQGLAQLLLDHSLTETNKMGFEQVYLSTDLEGFYEKKGWKYFGTGYGVGGDPFKIYAHTVKA